jgi:hypothetical protein
MSTSDWEEIRENVTKSFQDGKEDGKDHVDVTTGLLWLERQRNDSLCAALEKILRVARAALDGKRSAPSRPANLMQMVIDPGTGLPSHQQIQSPLMGDGQSHPSQETPLAEVAGKDRTSNPGPYAFRDTTKL